MTENNSTLEDDFLKKEIEEVEKNIDDYFENLEEPNTWYKIKRDNLHEFDFDGLIIELKDIEMLKEKLKTLKKCQDKFKQHLSEFIRKLKEDINNPFISKGELLMITDKLAKEELGGLVG